MARSLTTAAATQAARKDGPRPVHILQISFRSGTRYWSDEDRTTPVSAEGRVIQWGELQLDAQPRKTGGMGTLSLTIRDDDHFLKGEAENQPGYQRVDAVLYLWFAGTTWPTDAVTLFAGVLTAPCEWDEVNAQVKLTMRGRETLHDPHIGFLMTHYQFPEIDCKQCENEIIPIVYGNPCRRVPACVVNRPGVAQIATQLTLLPPLSDVTIDQGAAAAAFTLHSNVDMIVGWPSRWERITGKFDTSADTTFNIASSGNSRGSIYAHGTLTHYAAGGLTYLAVTKSDLPDNGAAGRGGYPMLMQQDDSSWICISVTHWWQTGSIVIFAIKGSDMHVSDGNAWKLLSAPGEIPIWPVGTPCVEDGTWTYIVNFLPSKSVDSVEIRARVNVAGGDSHVKWATINPAYYSVNLNNKTYNNNLGRNPSTDPGVTTVTLDYSPTQLGADSENIYVTLKGITDDNTATGTVLEDPCLVAQNLLMNRWLGNVPSSRVDSTSFTDAAAIITTRVSFALLDEKQTLNSIVSDIAYQAGCVFFWDGGKATVRYIKPTTLLSDSQFTVSNATRKSGSLKVSEIDAKEFITELVGKFRRTVPDNEQRIIRGSEAVRQDGGPDASSAAHNAGKTDFGVQRDEIDFWAYQFPSSVALATESWLLYRLTTNRLVTVDLFLDALKLQPGDTIRLDASDGRGRTIFNAVPARIRSIRMKLGSASRGEAPNINVVAEVQVYNYGITVVVPSDTSCSGQNVSGGRARSRKLAVRSVGPSKGLHVVDPPVQAFGIGDAGGDSPYDPTVGWQSGADRPRTGTSERPSGGVSLS